MIESPLISALSNKKLELHILPTEQCNFRCVYCYEDFKLGKMRPTMVSAIKKFLSVRLPEINQLKIAWFGGEPLAALDVVLDISHYAKSNLERSGGTYHFGMTTNGYLLNSPRFESLIEAGVRGFQISLDGPEDVHNRTRLRADGGNTFERIWNNLLQMAQSKHAFETVLRIHVTPDNYREIPRLLAKIKSEMGADPRFQIFLKSIANLGGPNAGAFDVLRGKDREEVMNDLKSLIGDDMHQVKLDQPGKPYQCYASAQNAWVIRSDGRLAKCTVAFNDDQNHIGNLNEDGTLSLDQNKIQWWLRGLRHGDQAIMSCPAYAIPRPS